MIRGKAKIENTYKLKDSYEYYIKDKDEDSPYNIDWKLYKQMCDEMFKKLYLEYMLESSAELQLPRLGNMSIIKQLPKTWSPKSLKIDFNATRIYGKTIYHLNEHTDGFKFRVYWNKQNSLTRNKTKYYFIPTRFNKRYLASLINEGKTDYFEI